MKKPENEKRRARDEARKKVRLQEKEKILLERRLVSEGKIYPRAHYMPRGHFRGILAVILAFFLGILFAFGGLIGGGAYLGTKVSIDDVFGLFGISPDTYNKYIDEEYSKLTVLQLVDEMIHSEYKSLGDIVKYSPFLDETVDKLLTVADNYGATVDKDILLGTQFGALVDYFQNDVLRSIVIGKAAGLKKGDNAILLALCYGEEGTDYTFNGDGTIQVENPDATLTVGKVMGQDSFQEVLNGIRLGTLLSISSGVTEEDFANKSVLFALSYGKRGVDYEIENGSVVILNEEKAVTVGQLMGEPDNVINGVELGTLLNIDSDVTDEKLQNNSMMYALCYGSRGTDYEVADGKIEMLPGHGELLPVTVGDLRSNSTSLIQNLEIETVMNIKPGSDKAMHYLAYGSEVMKGKAPYSPSPDGKYTDADGKTVDAHGYLLGEDGGYLTEQAPDKDGVPTDTLQYAGGGRYVYIYDAENKVTGIRMLPDPNSADGTLYEKRRVKDLTGEDADLLGNAKIGDFMTVGEDASPLMQTLKNWKISDLQDESKLESLQIGQLIEVEDGEDSSKILQALKDRTLGDLKKQETINELKLGDLLDLESEGGAKFLSAMKDWKVGDLNNQNRINRLKIGQLFESEGSSKLMTAIKDWRLGDLTKQEKIDSLTLGDVIEIEGESGILASLKDTPIGGMQEKIDSLHLSDILDAEELDNNDILKHLKDSTLTTLAFDVQNLTLGEVFGSEIYSYMEIKNVDGEARTYKWLEAHYFGEISEEYRTANKEAHPELDKKDKSGYVYKYYYQLEDFNKENAYRPQALPSAALTGLKTVYETAAGKSAVLAYSLAQDVYTALPVGVAVHYDSVVNMENIKNTTSETPYYIEEVYVLTPVYEYYVYDYDKGETAGKYEGERLSDDFGEYYLDGEGERIDLEPVLTGYTYEGTTYSLAEGKITWKDGKQYAVSANKLTLRTPVYEMYVSEDAKVERETVIAKYSYTPEGRGEVELERYLSGVWYLLLNGSEKGADTAILDVAGLISGVNSGMQDSTFAELWFHEILEDNPYASLVIAHPLPGHEPLIDGITFSHAGGEEHTVHNLIEVRLSEVVALINQLLKDLNDAVGALFH